MKKYLILAGTLMVSATAFATDVCTGTGASGTTLNVIVGASISNGNNTTGDSTGMCTMGGLTFSNFDVFGNTGWASGATLNLSVTVDNPAAGELAIGYNSNVPVGDFILTFTVTGSASSVTLLDGTATQVAENVCNSSGVNGTYGDTSQCVTQLAHLSVASTGPISATANWTPTATEVITKDISGGSEVYQQFVPEPMTFSLLGAGLLGLGLLRRRAQK